MFHDLWVKRRDGKDQDAETSDEPPIGGAEPPKGGGKKRRKGEV